jgi:hypothetical protein
MRTLKSPVDGVVAAIGNGRVVIEITPEIVELRAGARQRDQRDDRLWRGD